VLTINNSSTVLQVYLSMNVFKPTSGRKRDSPIWQYFVYDAPTDKSRCSALDSNGVQCTRTMSGKNPTNLATHLRTAHKELHAEYTKKLDEWKPQTPGPAAKSVCTVNNFTLKYL
jgi:hypothetical protein